MMPTTPIIYTRIHRVLMALALGLLGFYFVVYVVYAVNLMQFPFDYDQGEGFELVDTIMFSQGEWPYRNTEAFPFYSSNYPPLFHIIAAPLVPVFGTNYAYGRFLGFFGTLVTASLIGYAVYREGRNRWLAIVSGLAFLASNTVYHIGPLFRQHATMVLFEVAAVVILAHANEITDVRKRRWRLALGLGLIIAGGYTKQLAIVTALAAGLFLFIRQPRRAVVWGLMAAVAGAAIFVGINIVTNGEWWRQAILANVNELKIIQTIALFKQWFGLHGFLIVPAVLLVIYELYWDRLSLYAIWFVVAVGINGAASGTWGGGDSYFSTAIAATCILSGIFAARSVAGWKFPTNYLTLWLVVPFQRYRASLLAASLVVVPLLYLGYGRAVLHMPTNMPVFEQIAGIFNITPNAMNGFYDSARTQDGQYATGYANIGHLTTQADIDAGWRIVELVRASEKPVISEDAAFTLLADRPAITNPTQLLNLEKKGLYDGSQLVQMIDDRAFGLIILRAQFYPDVVLQAISRAYTQTDTITMNGFNYLILEPKPTD
ncbi:MAG: phospholipid carrier-dependent glycosyltransferase [Chloroflexi bacterium]|nr:phospholipid carrier-dependent glycosyltransferase [Chloroflexota bacterium]MCC6895581.1 phospholipid carrier-dependent glycosyltransferase [Anaerolineae bacterium]